MLGVPFSPEGSGLMTEWRACRTKSDAGSRVPEPRLAASAATAPAFTAARLH